MESCNGRREREGKDLAADWAYDVVRYLGIQALSVQLRTRSSHARGCIYTRFPFSSPVKVYLLM